MPEGDIKLLFIIIGDDAYPLLPFLIKFFIGNNISEVKRKFNERVSRVRRSLEHAF